MQQSVQMRGGAEQPIKPASVVDPAFMPFLTVGAAISALLFPHAEVAIHDLRTDRIVAIWNAFSRREVGDPSLLGDIADQLDAAAVFGPYDKADATGGRLKSVSAWRERLHELHDWRACNQASTSQGPPRPPTL